jgi:hypothetical protein
VAAADVFPRDLNRLMKPIDFDESTAVPLHLQYQAAYVVVWVASPELIRCLNLVV